MGTDNKTESSSVAGSPAIVRSSVLKHSLQVEPLVPALGAEITNINVADAIHDPDLAAELSRLWRQYKVLFFRDQQDISNADHQAFAQLFGDLEEHPIFKGSIPDAPLLVGITNRSTDGSPKINNARENGWHADLTYTKTPPAGAVLRMLEGPAIGGDTMWANMALIYESLPQDVKDLIDGLYAYHTIEPLFFAPMPTEQRREMAAKHPPVEHPVVVKHPVTGEKCLYVNSFFVHYFSNYYNVERVPRGAEMAKSVDLLRYLNNQATNPEFQVRLRWRAGTIAMWDNMLTQHYAVYDYSERRTMVRATIKGFPVSN